MLIFYIICGFLIFAISGVILQYNRLAIYRRRVIKRLAQKHTHHARPLPFVLSTQQEQQIKQCFLKGTSIRHCIEHLS